MAKTRGKGRTIGIIAIVVIIVLAIGYVVRDRLVVGDTAGAADSTTVDSTAAASGKADKDEKDGDKKKPQRIPVEVVEAGVREISSYYVTTATLQPEKKVDILTKTTGEVSQLAVEEGDIVRAGDLLARIDDREQKILLDEARIKRDQEQREMNRIKEMHSQNLISEKEWGDAEHRYSLAENTYQSALLKYQYTKILAPFAGVVSERLVDVGENVNVGAKLFVLSDTEPLLLTMFLPESELKAIRIGQTVHINPDVNPDAQIDGTIIRVSPEVDQRTGTVKVTAETRGGGVPGSFVRVRIVTDTRASTLTVPRRAIVSDSGERFVFIAAADTVRRIGVEVGYEDEEYAEVLSGIAEGDSIVTAGVGGIREGSKIKVLGRADDAVAQEAKN